MAPAMSVSTLAAMSGAAEIKLVPQVCAEGRIISEVPEQSSIPVASNSKRAKTIQSAPVAPKPVDSKTLSKSFGTSSSVRASHSTKNLCMFASEETVNWKIGDTCRVKTGNDELEAEITSLDLNMAVVKSVGYQKKVLLYFIQRTLSVGEGSLFYWSPA